MRPNLLATTDRKLTHTPPGGGSVGLTLPSFSWWTVGYLLSGAAVGYYVGKRG